MAEYRGFRLEKTSGNVWRVYGLHGRVYTTVGGRAVPVVDRGIDLDAPTLASARREVDMLIADAQAGRHRTKSLASEATRRSRDAKRQGRDRYGRFA